MSAKKTTIKQTKPDRSYAEDPKVSRCVGFHDLTLWQVEQYREAVGENRWYMGQKSNRWIEWAEAEQDFLNQGYYGCAEKWRQEYCGKICPFKNNCLLAFKMLKAAHPVPFPKAG